MPVIVIDISSTATSPLHSPTSSVIIPSFVPSPVAGRGKYLETIDSSRQSTAQESLRFGFEDIDTLRDNFHQKEMADSNQDGTGGFVPRKKTVKTSFEDEEERSPDAQSDNRHKTPYFPKKVKRVRSIHMLEEAAMNLGME